MEYPSATHVGCRSRAILGGNATQLDSLLHWSHTRRTNKDKQGQALRFDWPRNAFIAWVLRARTSRLVLPVSCSTTGPRFSLLAILHFRVRYHACPCFRRQPLRRFNCRNDGNRLTLPEVSMHPISLVPVTSNCGSSDWCGWLRTRR